MQESFFPMQSTTPLYLSMNMEVSCSLINRENDISGGINWVEIYREERKDISASVNDSVYLVQRYYGFTLQSRPVIITIQIIFVQNTGGRDFGRR